MMQIKLRTWNLATVEQMTGLSREVLRKWETRYHFPTPARGPRGERQFSTAEVNRLQLIGRLLKTGLRAGELVPLKLSQLQDLLESRQVIALTHAAPDAKGLAQAVQTLLETLAPGSTPGATNLFLLSLLEQHGLATFVASYLPAFNAAVGEAWLSQHISIATEHRYTHSVQQLVLRGLPALGQGQSSPVVLLTTPPGELHALGLLALHAQLSLQGAHCIHLGAQTPGVEVARAARELGVGVVAISASACMPPHELCGYLRDLRVALPKTCYLWIGGKGCEPPEIANLAGCEVFTDTTSAVQRWRVLANAKGVKSNLLQN